MTKKLDKEYILEIIKNYPKIKSGRKNYRDHELRINKIKKLILIFKKKIVKN